MGTDNPAVLIYDSLGNPVQFADGGSLSGGAAGLMLLAKDGTTARFLTCDGGGRLTIVGAGTAGSPLGGVLTIQGIASGTAVTVGGTVEVQQATASSLKAQVQGPGTIGAAPVGNPLFIGGTDGTSLQALRLHDLDTGGGTEFDLGVNLRISGAGGSIEAKGQKTMASSIPVVLASDQSTISVTQAPSGAVTGYPFGKIALGGGTVNTINAILTPAYNEQSVNAQRSLSSTSAADTNAAGNGARKVTIIYYDQTCAGPFTETVNLNGVGVVATANNNICFIEEMYNSDVGPGGANVGTITLWVNNVGGGGTIGTIGIGNVVAGVGDNHTFWAHHYVPPSKTASLATVVAGSSAASTIFLRARNPTVTTSPDLPQTEFLSVAAGGSTVRPLNYPVTVPGPARILAYGIPSANNATMNCSFDYSEK